MVESRWLRSGFLSPPPPPPPPPRFRTHAILSTLCSLEFAVELKVPVSHTQGSTNLSWVGQFNESSGLPQGLHQYIAQLVRELDGVAGPCVRFGMLCNFATTVFARMNKTSADMYSLQLWRLDVIPAPRSVRADVFTKPRDFTVASLVTLASAIRRFVFWGKLVA